MEKVLRKIYTKDRLPNKKGTYHCKRNSDISEITLYFIPDMPHYINKFRDVEYWYEEVSVKKAFEDYYAIQDLHNFDERQLVKERYEKAKYLLNTNQGLGTTELIDTCLKIAAGLKEDEV